MLLLDVCRRYVSSATAIAIVLAGSTAAAQVPVTIAWDPSGDGITAGYEVLVGLRPGSPIAVFDVGAQNRATLPLPPSAAYFVSVRGYTTLRESGNATPEMVVDLQTAPGVPVGIRTNVQGALASLAWQPPSRGGVPSGYLVSVGSAPGWSDVLSEAPVGNVLAASGSVPPGTYYARVQAMNLMGVGAPSPDAILQVGTSPPSPPMGFRAVWSNRRVQLTWNGPADGSAFSFVLEAGTAPGANDVGAINTGAARTFSAEVPPGKFFVRVRSVGAQGQLSLPSAELILQ